MTPIQIASLVAVAVVAAYFYLPAVKWPASKPNSMAQIQSVLSIRDTTTSQEVRQACSALLQALLK
jgi:hypothetical protein